MKPTLISRGTAPVLTAPSEYFHSLSCSPYSVKVCLHIYGQKKRRLLLVLVSISDPLEKVFHHDCNFCHLFLLLPAMMYICHVFCFSIVLDIYLSAFSSVSGHEQISRSLQKKENCLVCCQTRQFYFAHCTD